MQEPEHFRCHAGRKKVHARDVATRLVETCDEAEFDRVAAGCEDDRYCRVCSLGRNCRGGVHRSDHCHLTAYQIGRQLRQPIVVILRPAIFDSHVPALYVAGFAQTFAKCRHEMCDRLRRTGVEKPDHRHRWLLRAGYDRPRGRRAAEHRSELAPPDHSITSSAMARSVGGTVRPSMRAVSTLMTSSNLLACTTGKSAGLEPLRIRSEERRVGKEGRGR